MKVNKLFTVPILLLALLVSSAPATAQSARKKKAEQQKADEITSKNLRAHIYFLASDSLEGRRTGTPGEAKAVDYIKSQYAKLGIAPADEDKDYIQAFEIDEGKKMNADCQLTINGKVLSAGKEWFPLAWSAEGQVKASASLALHETGLPWWVDLKDALESNAGNPHFLPEQYVKETAKDAIAKGATALVLYNSSGKPDSIVFNGKDRTETAGLPVIYCTHKALQDLDITPESSPYIEAGIGFTAKKRMAHNVVAMIDNGAANTVVIGAHLDHLGYGEDENSRNPGDPAIHNGADDNASGTAAVLELARLLKENTIPLSSKKKKSTPVDINLKNSNYLFINFSGEELGLYGSKYFTEHPTIDLSKVKYMINMDMVGRLNDSSTLTIGGVGTSPAWGTVLPAGGTMGFNIKIDSSGTGPSDHTSFYRKNVPVLFFFTGLHSDYHKPGDDAEKVNYTGETRIIGYILQTLKNAATQAQFAFTKTREQTMTGSRYKVSVGIMPDYTFTGQGVRADGVIDGRPAQKAGLVTGDVIIRLGDYEVTGMDSYMQALNKFEKGQSTSIVVKRGNEEKHFQVTF
jgi:aminopeptidase YwaD